MTRFTQVKSVGSEVVNAQNMNALYAVLNQTDYGKELLKTLKTDWFFE
jgi:hypothetical protein